MHRPDPEQLAQILEMAGFNPVTPRAAMKPRSHYEALRASVQREVAGCTVPLQRTAETWLGNSHQTDQNRWTMPIEPGIGTEKWGYSLDMCFEGIEKVLMSNGAKYLKKLISLVQGIDESLVDTIDKATIQLIQMGQYHGIFKVDALFNGKTISFVATVSRDELFNEDIDLDYKGVKEVNKAATDQQKKPPYIKRYAQFKNPMGVYPSMYVAPFIKGAVEFNIAFREMYDEELAFPRRRVGIHNGLNQARKTHDLNPAATSSILRSIAGHEYHAAIASNRAFSAFINGGDFMVDHDTQEVFWHTHRDPVFVRDKLRLPDADIAAASYGHPNPATGLVCQVGHLIHQRELCIVYSDALGFPFGVDEIVGGIEDVRRTGDIADHTIQEIQESLKRGGIPEHPNLFKTSNQAIGRRTNRVIEELTQL